MKQRLARLQTNEPSNLNEAAHVPPRPGPRLSPGEFWGGRGGRRRNGLCLPVAKPLVRVCQATALPLPPALEQPCHLCRQWNTHKAREVALKPRSGPTVPSVVAHSHLECCPLSISCRVCFPAAINADCPGSNGSITLSLCDLGKMT